ncbi:VOC family protein [Streptomyces sp. NPDC048718]|uniref:VOC family protein n=1 Tax=Streptomyces sp. NPDC048718 TaxID=3365587 RepID=UPI003714B451
MSAISTAHMRVARPSRDLEAARRFWVEGLGLDVLYAHEADGGERLHSLLMVGWRDAGWHLELTRDPAAPLGCVFKLPSSGRRPGRAASGACDRKAEVRPCTGCTWVIRQRSERACQASHGRRQFEDTA